jgi:hypothetical protein
MKVSLKVDGRAVGDGAAEFARAWRTLAPRLESRKLVLDLRDVIYMDSEARQILTEIYRQTGAQILADTPMTKYFAEQARQDGAKKEN